MYIKDSRIDSGNAFDWGKTSEDYAKYRDIYPQAFYDALISRGLCVKNQTVLDLGTGTGVLPRNMYRYGAKWTGCDISENQIKLARRLSEGMNIEYIAGSAETADFKGKKFDIITACQCFWYFKHETLIPKIYDLLNPGGKFVVLCMEWLPFEDETARASENMVLKYSPSWSGAGETMKPIDIPKCYFEKFTLSDHTEFKLPVHFSRESWNGRMKACRGIGASLSEEKIAKWEKEHMELLKNIAPEEFDVKHFAAIAVLTKR